MLRHAFTILFLVLYLNAPCQTSKNLKKILSQIKGIPAWYTKGYTYESKSKNFKNVDSTYKVIAKMDTMALYRLWGALADTTATAILNTCDGGHLTYGQLAFLRTACLLTNK
jgi:hypothetical protein